MAACVHGWARGWVEQSCSLSLRFDVDEHAEYRKRRLWLNEFASDQVLTSINIHSKYAVIILSFGISK